MKNLPSPITKDNFDQAQAFIAGQLALTKAKKRIRKIIRPLGSLLFTLLSLLLVYGAIYGACDPEDMVVMEKFTFLTKAWDTFAGIFTNEGMAWYVSWLILIAAAFVLPLLVSAIITIIVLAVSKTKAEATFEGTDAEKAKKLYDDACAISKGSSNYDSGSTKTVFKVIFTAAIAAFLVFAFLTFKIGFSMSMLIGFAIAAVLVYFVYGWILSAFYALNKLFYKSRYIPALTSATEEYWLSVDVEEANRRKAEAERKAEKERKAEEKREAEAKRTAARQSAASYQPSASSIDKYDSFTWTNAYVQANEDQCSDIALSTLKVSKELLSEGDYSGAALGFDKVVRALELLKNVDGGDYYLPPLFANCYALCHIFAFGLNNQRKACEYAKKACDYASKCNSASASRDLQVMRDFYNALLSASSISSLTDEFDINFPYDILSKD
ncbi:MAG: hypothetical protein IJX01_02125 [Oscillospiraceae bacterium]|nr:hypothetical protein [Oscillospiraceae bacterium]